MSRKAFVACLLLALSATAAASQRAAQTKLSVAKVANDFALMQVGLRQQARHVPEKMALQLTVSEITQAKMIQANDRRQSSTSRSPRARRSPLRPKARRSPASRPCLARRRFSSRGRAEKPDHVDRSIASPHRRGVKSRLADRLGGVTDCAARALAVRRHQARVGGRHPARDRDATDRGRRRRGRRHRRGVQSRRARRSQDSRQFRRPDRKIPKPDRLRVQQASSKRIRMRCAPSFVPGSRRSPTPAPTRAKRSRSRPEQLGVRPVWQPGSTRR